MEKRDNTIIVVLLAVFVILFLGLTGYVVYDKVLMKNEESHIEEPANNENVLEEEIISYTFNKKKHGIKFVYEVVEDDDEYNKYGVYFNIYLNDIKVFNEVGYPIYYTDTKDHIKSYVNYKLTENNIDLLNNDKEYLVLYFDVASPTYVPSQILLLINESGVLIEAIDLGTVQFVLEDKATDDLYNGKKYYIKDNYLLYLEEFSSYECEQTIITIENDKVEYLSQGFYTLESIAGES